LFAVALALALALDRGLADLADLCDLCNLADLCDLADDGDDDAVLPVACTVSYWSLTVCGLSA
jgi:hypothetical protein